LALWHCSGTMEEEEKCTLESFSSLVCNSWLWRVVNKDVPRIQVERY
jgi:hypothetical protein